jgi:pyridoxal phosphate enzyme (YggS family)
MAIRNNIANFTAELTSGCMLIAVSKTQPNEKIQAAYDAGLRMFGENKAQEMVVKYESSLPKDIQWHMIGHLQRNKVKYIAPFVSLIHSVDSARLLEEINKQGEKCGRVISCLAQIYIAHEETKFGFEVTEFLEFLRSDKLAKMKFISLDGLMGMATFTENKEQVRNEFRKLKIFFEKVKGMTLPAHVNMKHLSMGMSGDYKIAMEEGSTMIRIGTAIFGERNYN